MSEQRHPSELVFSRRAVLRAIGVAGTWLVAPGCASDGPSGSDGTGNPSPTTTPSTDTTSAPDVVVSGDAPNGDPVHLRLRAAPSTAEIVAGRSTEVWSFTAEVLEGDDRVVAASGSYLGPTLHVRQGQTVRVTFENQLPEQPSIVHWHGLVVPQAQDGQPPEAVPTGETYEYEFVVENEPGTYWYHPHPHLLTGEQVYRGLAGLLIVHGSDDGPDASLPSGPNDISLVLQDRTVRDDGRLRYVANRHDQMAGFVGSTLVANGRAGYTATVRPGPYRLRILNGANSRTQYLTWSTGDPMHTVATDGALLPEPVDSPGIVLTPAQRSDIWVDFSDAEPGTEVRLLSATVFVESGGMGGGTGGMGGMGGGELVLDGDAIATFVVGAGEPRPGTLPDRLADPPSLRPSEAVNADAPKEFVLSTFRATHWINDSVWEGRSASELETVGADTVELWEFVNRSPMIHPMHLHGNAFRVVERSWDDDALADAWSQIEAGVVETGWRDTVLVFPGQRVRIAIPFASHRGYFLYHCHILEHEDQGMMRNFRVV